MGYDDDNSDEDEDEDKDEDEDEDENEDENELAGIQLGMKRKAAEVTQHAFPTKVAKTTAQDSPSTAALGAIDDNRPDITLIDVPVGEDILQHPYGRHVCLYMEVKVNASKKPNPQEVVSPSIRVVLYYEGMPLNRSRRSQVHKGP